ncbi:MAG: nucleotidyltransferase [Acutalibacteraceae bacterium]|nr:nucleotidyltransferase [Acutalibacteraceae bacterium]
MNNYAIISEFNPFHKGHKFLIDSCKANGTTHITAIMSGNFVQRGDVAVISKKHRTEMALRNGVDLVIELPLPYAVSNAQTFARGGISVADSMGCVNCLAFASECGNIEALEKIAKVTASSEFEDFFKNEISKGVSYPTALSNAVGNIEVDLRDIISSPNNVLGIEYIKALKEINSDITPFTIIRKGDSHNSTEIFSEFASASNIRRLLAAKEDVTNYIPENCVDILAGAIKNGELATLKNNSAGVILKLRDISDTDISKIADVSEGLENRLYNAIRTGCSIEEIIEKTKSRRYTYARIRRLIISCLLGITKDYTSQKPDYIRVLGFTKKGAEILNTMKKTSCVPIVTKLTNLPEDISQHAKKLLELEVRSTDLYYTFTENLKVCGIEYKDGLVIIK